MCADGNFTQATYRRLSFERQNQTFFFLRVSLSGCSRSKDRLPTTTTTVFSDNKFPGTRDAAPVTKLKAFTQRGNPTFTSVVKRLHSQAIRKTVTWTMWLTIAWLLLINVVLE